MQKLVRNLSSFICSTAVYDGDGDRNVGVCDSRLSFHSKYDDDDDAWRHEKKCSHEDLPVTVNDAAACSTAV